MNPSGGESVGESGVWARRDETLPTVEKVSRKKIASRV